MARSPGNPYDQVGYQQLDRRIILCESGLCNLRAFVRCLKHCDTEIE